MQIQHFGQRVHFIKFFPKVNSLKTYAYFFGASWNFLGTSRHYISLVSKLSKKVISTPAIFRFRSESNFCLDQLAFMKLKSFLKEFFFVSEWNVAILFAACSLGRLVGNTIMTFSINLFRITTTDRKPNDSDWLRRAIIKIFYYPQSHLAQPLTLWQNYCDKLLVSN